MAFISCQQSGFANRNVGNLQRAFVTKDEDAFLEQFPQNFKEIQEYFGWDEELERKNTLYDSSNSYIKYFFNIVHKRNNSVLNARVLHNCYNGYWAPDALNYYQQQTLKFLKENSYYSLLDRMSADSAKSVLKFLVDNPHPKMDSVFYGGLNNRNKRLVSALFKQKPSLNLASGWAEVDSDNYNLRSIDINGDGLVDKILFNKYLKGDTLLIYLNKKGRFEKVLEGSDFYEDGGNRVKDIYPMPNGKGFLIVTFFPGGGEFYKCYSVKPVGDKWILCAVTYISDVPDSKGDSAFICLVPHHSDMSLRSLEVKDMPNEELRQRECEIRNKTAEITKLIYDKYPHIIRLIEKARN